MYTFKNTIYDKYVAVSNAILFFKFIYELHICTKPVVIRVSAFYLIADSFPLNCIC